MCYDIKKSGRQKIFTLKRGRGRKMYKQHCSRFCRHRGQDLFEKKA